MSLGIGLVVPLALVTTTYGIPFMSTIPQFETSIRPPPGVSFTQWGDGTIRIKYSVRDVLAIRRMLLQLARSLTDEALAKLQADKIAEIERQKLPLTRLQTINQEMQSLQNEMKSIDSETVDLQELQQAIDQRIKSAEAPLRPVVSEEASPIENAPGVSVSTTVDVGEFAD